MATYVVASAAWSVWARTGANLSWPGLVVTASALPIMYVLARRKTAVADVQSNRASLRHGRLLQVVGQHFHLGT